MRWHSRLIFEHGVVRAELRSGEGEFVCAACDQLMAAPARPLACHGCGSDRIETLTPPPSIAP